MKNMLSQILGVPSTFNYPLRDCLSSWELLGPRSQCSKDRCIPMTNEDREIRPGYINPNRTSWWGHPWSSLPTSQLHFVCLVFFFYPLPSTKHCLWNLLQSKLYVKICFQGKPLCGIMWSILSIKCLQEIDNSISTGLNNKKTLLSHVTWSPEVGLLQGSLIQWLTKTIQSPKFLSFSSAILSMVALYLSLAFLTLTKWITWRQHKGKDWYFPGESFLRPRHPFPERVTSGWPPFSHWPEMGLTSPSKLSLVNTW